MEPEILSFAGPDGLPLQGFLWRSAGKKLLLIVHGYGEHARRYLKFGG
jgi:alpha-beta hydrolase superfamily lysophospholipase